MALEDAMEALNAADRTDSVHQYMAQAKDGTVQILLDIGVPVESIVYMLPDQAESMAQDLHRYAMEARGQQ
jgi:hypothetical protein